MVSNNKTYILWVVIILLSTTSLAFAQRGLKSVSFPQGFEACASDMHNSFELTVEWTPPMPVANNVYRIELSDANGNFPNPDFQPIELKTKNNSPRFTQPISFPKNVSGKGYRIKVTSSNPYSVRISEPFSAYYISIRKHLSINDKKPNITLCPGETQVISVDETGAGAYRWYRNGQLIPDAKGPTYKVSTPGTYQAEVDYGDGFCTASADTKSNKVTVSVQGQTSLKVNGGATSAYICQGDSYTLNASIKDESLDYTWYRDGKQAPGDSSGKGKSTYTTPAGVAAAGKYYVRVGNKNSSCQEKSNELEVRIRQQLEVEISMEGGEYVLPNSEKKLVAKVKGGQNPTYQWEKNGVEEPGATGKEYVTKSPGIYNVKVTDKGDCVVERRAKTPIKLSYPDKFEGGLSNMTYYSSCATNKVTLGVRDVKAVIGTQKISISPSAYGDLDYKWYKDDVLLSDKSGRGKSEIELDGASHNGSYQVVIEQSGRTSAKLGPFPVKLADATNIVTLKASYNPSDGGGVVHLCSDFNKGGAGERLTVEGVTDNTAVYTWYKDNSPIPLATGDTYDAKEFGEYRVEITGSSSCPIITNSLLLKEIQIEAKFRNIAENEDSVLFLPYNKPLLITDIAGVDVGKSKISWFHNGSLISGTNGGTYSVTDQGSYRYEVKPDGTCREVSSRTIHVRKPESYNVSIGYLEGSEACNDVKDVKLTLKSLEAVIKVATDTKTITIPEKFYEHYNFEWYKKDESTNVYVKDDTATSTTLTIKAEDSELASYYLVVESKSESLNGKSDEIKAGSEKITTVVKVGSGADAYATNDNQTLICQGEAIVLKAEVTTTTPLSDLTYQWYRGTEEIVGATSPTLSVSQEGTYRVNVSGRKCKEVPSSQYTIKYFTKDAVKFYRKGSDKPEDLSKLLQFIKDEPLELIVKGARVFSALNVNGFADGVKNVSDLNEQKIEISATGEYNIEVGIGICKIMIGIKAEEKPLPSETPTVVTPNNIYNQHWNLPDKYMEKSNVKVSIYTQDGVEVMSTTNFRYDSWPKEVNKEFTGRAVIYLYIVEVDGTVEEKGTITLFQ